MIFFKSHTETLLVSNFNYYIYTLFINFCNFDLMEYLQQTTVARNKVYKYKLVINYRNVCNRMKQRMYETDFELK